MPRVDAAALGFGFVRLSDRCATGERKRGVPPPPDNISIIDAGEIAQPFIFDSVIRGGNPFRRPPIVGMVVYFCYNKQQSINHKMQWWRNATRIWHSPADL